MSDPGKGQQPSSQPGRSQHEKGKQRVTSHDPAPQTPTVILDEALAPEDDWTNVDDPIERRKIQNRLAQRKLREKSRLQKEATARDTQNRKMAASAYTGPDLEDTLLFEDDATTGALSGAPWGTYPMGMALRRVSSTHTHSSMGKSRASSQASASRASSSTRTQVQHQSQQHQSQQQQQQQQQQSTPRGSSHGAAVEASAGSARGRRRPPSAQDSSYEPRLMTSPLTPIAEDPAASPQYFYPTPESRCTRPTTSSTLPNPAWPSAPAGDTASDWASASDSPGAQEHLTDMQMLCPGFPQLYNVQQMQQHQQPQPQHPLQEYPLQSRQYCGDHTQQLTQFREGWSESDGWDTGPHFGLSLPLLHNCNKNGDKYIYNHNNNSGMSDQY